MAKKWQYVGTSNRISLCGFALNFIFSIDIYYVGS